ncbi:RNA helicase [Hamiltosporidium tvaerminnensis]|uniref:ATP-dependent RNA helicase n=1 Tax=Hamiltosporidium tvaerminnensis TaxID=1176355 RepID=A0A4Q9LWI4_9MICR|nr:RNA helicase [Hamiltosporidium tvaerminnensis]
MNIKDLSLHKPIKRALKENKIENLTEIQQLTIPAAMSGKDILGISKTGSGKTLCFVIPLLQRLVDNKWCMEDGLGGLIITPTRELAVQIFNVLKKIGKNCYLSCGLIIGGIESKGEKEVIGKMNILVCTPGRLLHHILETPYFDISNVQILVIDETDKLLEMGFKKDILEIMSYLPVKRQNIFLSATPKSINQKNLFIDFDSIEIFSAYKNENTNENKKVKNNLEHFFYVLSICDKVEYLYTILKNNNSKKIIVFFSTCKEAKFYFLVFSKLKMRCKFYLLNGSIKQEKRMEVYDSFKREKSGILFCTDVVSRGLDFPGVDVVIQYDCPERVETYVHRAGRTGRFDKEGISILFLLESEKGIIQDINKGKWKEGSKERGTEGKKGNLGEECVSEGKKGSVSGCKEGNVSERSVSEDRKGSVSGCKEGNVSERSVIEGKKGSVSEGKKGSVSEGKEGNVSERSVSEGKKGSVSGCKEGNVSERSVIEGKKGSVSEGKKGSLSEGKEVKSKKNKEYSNDKIIYEGKKLEIKKIQNQIKSLIAEHEEIKIFAEKYIKTFYRFIEMNSKKYLEGTKEQICKLKEYFGFEDFSDESEEEFENIRNTKESDNKREDNKGDRECSKEKHKGNIIRQDDKENEERENSKENYKRDMERENIYKRNKKSQIINNSKRNEEFKNIEYLNSDRKINKKRLVGKVKNTKIIFDENGNEEEFYRDEITKKEIEEGLEKKGYK